MNYIGEIKIFAGDYVPAGWLQCGGQSLPIPKYKELFSVIGFDYTRDTGSSGAAGAVYFNLPSQKALIPGTIFIICVEGYLSVDDRSLIFESTYSDIVQNGRIKESRDRKLAIFNTDLEYYEQGGKWDNFNTEYGGGYRSNVYSIGPVYDNISEACAIDPRTGISVEAFYNTRDGIYYTAIDYQNTFDGHNEFYQDVTSKYKKIIQIGTRGEVNQEYNCY